ncbi:MAG: polysaccharide biosynthesis C-terminal domain-containing protein [Flavobacteriales bacterium]
MLVKVIHTLGSRVLIAVLNLVLLVLTTNLMGAESRGQISLFILNLSLATLISGFAGGPSLVYLAPRVKTVSILLINTIWTLVSVPSLVILLYQLGLITTTSTAVFLGIAIIESFLATNLMLLLGKEQVHRHNLLQVIKVIIPVAGLVAVNFYLPITFETFVWFYAFSIIITFILSLFYLIRDTNIKSFSPGLVETVKLAFNFGIINQLGNVAQLMNYRLSYYLLELLISPPQLAFVRIGIFSASMQISESLWHFTRSVNTVQHATVSNITDRHAALMLSIKLLKLNYLVTGAGILVIWMIPNDFFIWTLGDEFIDVKSHFLLLAPGIFALAFSGAINHFFAGIGDLKYNTRTSIFGFLLAILLYYPSIKLFETEGAAICTSIVYLFQAVWQFKQLKNSDHVMLNDLTIKSGDISWLKSKFSRGS